MNCVYLVPEVPSVDLKYERDDDNNEDDFFSQPLPKDETAVPLTRKSYISVLDINEAVPSTDHTKCTPTKIWVVINVYLI